MKKITNILFFLAVSITAFGTPQEPETLIYQGDTMFVDFYPLEDLMSKNKDLNDKIMSASDFVISSCWRGHHGTWEIINDSLFLTKLENVSGRELKLSDYFQESEIDNNRIFAYWFSLLNVSQGYGQHLDFDEENWTDIYEGNFSCKITSGIISNIKITMKDKAIIDSIVNNKILKQDTMICLVVDTYPILIAEEKEYEIKEIKNFVQKHIRYPANGNDCEGAVYISVLIEKDGSVSEKKFIRKVCQGYDEEAMKVVDLMVKWKPGLIKGQPVRTRVVLPLRWRYE